MAFATSNSDMGVTAVQQPLNSVSQQLTLSHFTLHKKLPLHDQSLFGFNLISYLRI
jgi:hypothetical protein